MPELYWEDFYPGQTFEHGPRRLPRDEMLAFAAEYDPQPMHLDDAAARDTMLGGIGASGWYLCCVLMEMSVTSFLGRAASMGAPGVEEVRWLKPVRPDDELTLHVEVLETRTSKSRPDTGFIRNHFELHDPAGQPVMTLVTTLMITRRGSAAA